MKLYFHRPGKPATWEQARDFAEAIIHQHPPHSVDVQDEDGVLAVTFTRRWWQPAVSEQTLRQCREAATAAARLLGWTEGFPTTDAVTEPGPSLPELNEEALARHFGGLLNRESHIRLIYDALSSSARSGFTERAHVLLYGDPAGGKTKLLRAFSGFLGPRLWWHIDLSTTTQAGLECELLHRAKKGVLQPYIGLEEIEKAKPAVLGCLLQVADERARVQRTNARGDDSAVCRSVLIATCNSVKRLSKRGEGPALLSRFGFKVPVLLPDVESLRQILLAYVKQIKGDPAWVGPVMSFMAEYNSTDPRMGKALLAGRDRLLDGSFLADYRRAYGLETRADAGDVRG